MRFINRMIAFTIMLTSWSRARRLKSQGSITSRTFMTDGDVFEDAAVSTEPKVAPAPAPWSYVSAMNPKLKAGIAGNRSLILPECTPRLDTGSLQMFNRITEMCMEIIVPIHVGVSMSIGFDGVMVAEPKNVWRNGHKTVQGMISVSILVWMGPVSIVFYVAGVVTISSPNSKDLGSTLYYACKSLYPKFLANEAETLEAAKKATEEKLALLQIPYQSELEWARWALELSDRTRMLLTSIALRIERQLERILASAADFGKYVSGQIRGLATDPTNLGLIKDFNDALITRIDEMMEEIGVGKASTKKFVESVWAAWEHISSHIQMAVTQEEDVAVTSLSSLVVNLRRYRAWLVAYIAHSLADEVARGVFGKDGQYNSLDFCMTVEDTEVPLLRCHADRPNCYVRFPGLPNAGQIPPKIKAGGKALCSLLEGYESHIPSDINAEQFRQLLEYFWNIGAPSDHGLKIPGAILKLIPRVFVELKDDHMKARAEANDYAGFGNGVDKQARAMQALRNEDVALRTLYGSWMQRLRHMKDDERWAYRQARNTPVFEFNWEGIAECDGMHPGASPDRVLSCAREGVFGPLSLHNIRSHEKSIQHQLGVFNSSEDDPIELSVSMHVRAGFLFNMGHWKTKWGICGLPTFEATLRPTMTYSVLVDKRGNLKVGETSKETALVILSFPIGGSARFDLRYIPFTGKLTTAIAIEVVPGGLTGASTLAYHVAHKLIPLVLEMLKEAPTKDDVRLNSSSPSQGRFMDKMKRLDTGHFKSMLGELMTAAVANDTLLREGFKISDGITFQQSRMRLKITYTRTPDASASNGFTNSMAASLVTFSYVGYKMTKSPIMHALHRVADFPIRPGIVFVYCDQTDWDISGTHLRNQYNKKCPKTSNVASRLVLK